MSKQNPVILDGVFYCLIYTPISMSDPSWRKQLHGQSLLGKVSTNTDLPVQGMDALPLNDVIH